MFHVSGTYTDVTARASAPTPLPSISIEFPGAAGTTGTFTEVAGAAVSYIDDTGKFFITTGPGTGCTVDVTAYGPVSDLIEGTFSATVSDGSTTCSITNGAFSVVRAADM